MPLPVVRLKHIYHHISCAFGTLLVIADLEMVMMNEIHVDIAEEAEETNLQPMPVSICATIC